MQAIVRAEHNGSEVGRPNEAVRAKTMKAIHFRRYGSPDVLELEDVDLPVLEDDQVLLRVRAASVNPYDWHFMRGKPYMVHLVAGLTKPKDSRLGADVAGRVEAVGANVKE